MRQEAPALGRNVDAAMDELTHLDEHGRARMVDVSGKDATAREATARGEVRTTPEVVRLVASGEAPKGDVLAAARIAGIMAAKRTSDLIPLSHPLPVSAVSVDLSLDEPGGRVLIEATVRTTAQTGVEMEALTAVAVTALTVYDMLKAADRAMTIERVRLIRKSGGRGGSYEREE